MEFKSWLKEEGCRGRAAKVAAHFRVSVSAVSQWMDNGVPPSKMIDVQAFTKGRVTLQDMLMHPARTPKPAAEKAEVTA